MKNSTNHPSSSSVTSPSPAYASCDTISVRVDAVLQEWTVMPYVIDESEPLRMELLERIHEGYGKNAYRLRKDDPVTNGMTPEQFLFYTWGRYLESGKCVMYRQELTAQDPLLEKTLRTSLGSKVSKLIPHRPNKAVLARARGQKIRKSFPEKMPLRTPAELLLQTLRDEVRAMVVAWKPMDGIPLYTGPFTSGNPVIFLNRYYYRYLPGQGNNTLFLHDLKVIDPRLYVALGNAPNIPIGPKSDLSDALINRRFTDGPTTESRIRAILSMRKTRESKKTQR